MSEGITFFDELLEEQLANLNTCMPARIESYDPAKLKAVVTPLFKRKFKDQDPVSMPPIIEVPVSCLRAGGFIIRPPYKKGDIVLLVFAQRALDNVIGTGMEADPQHNRKHSLDDAIVINGLKPFTSQLPSEHANDLVIGTEDFQAKIVITPGGNINISASTITLNGTGGVNIVGPSGTGSW